ncbi:MAG: hypothetical protein MJY79_03595 [Bacteroidaceae bacterium]|nr:hypothetical protein [Bacteroidaceae bacterium]
MPYRRLPNTDKARIRSMKMALDKLRNDIGYVPILKPELVDRAERVLSRCSMASDQ